MSRSIAQSSRHNSRLRLGEAAVLPVPQAIALLPLADKEAKSWLEENNLVHQLRGRRVVIWGDVLRQLTAEGEVPPPKPQPTRSKASLRRVDLGGGA